DIITFDYDLGPTNGGNYYVRGFDGKQINSGIDRTLGWHQFTIDCKPNVLSISIDGQKIVSANNSSSIDWISLEMSGASSRPPGVTYFDDFEFTEYSLVDLAPTSLAW